MTSVGKRPPSQVLQIPIPAIRTPFVTQIRMQEMRQVSEGVVANSSFSLIREALKFGKPYLARAVGYGTTSEWR